MLPLLFIACRDIPVDEDGDGYPTEKDCDDKDPSLNPNRDESCDGIDNNCNGEIDEHPVDGTSYYSDADGDGHGGDPAITPDAAGTRLCSDPGAGYSTANDDCDDADAAVYAGATETCDGKDNDCDGVSDEDDPPTSWYLDADGDGYGDSETGVSACEQPADGYVDNGDDCNDTDARYHPGADESDCTDPADYNCDGSSAYDDADVDNYPACEECDDSDASVYPGAPEYCNDTDDDCDGESDEDAVDASTWYADDDEDGYGDAAITTSACEQPEGTSENADDCDDSNDAISPAATEQCDTRDVDEDCDGDSDDNDASVTETTDWYPDDDSDGYGDANASGTAIETACEQPSGYVDDSADCDDSDAGVSPAATEVCDTADTDEDCNGLTDDDDAGVAGTTTWYPDDDGDGYGDANASGTAIEAACEQPSGYVDDSADCDDSDAGVSPAATEVCDTTDTDEDCDSLTDDDDGSVDTSTMTTWYADDDGDGYGDSTETETACEQPSGYTADADDCDNDDAVFPGATEVCNDGIINDCDSTTDTCTHSGDIDMNDASVVAATLSGSKVSDLLGTVAVSGDLDGDGQNDALVGAPSQSGTGNAGSVYAFNGPVASTTNPDADADAIITGVAAEDQFGSALGGGQGCDLNGDASDDFAVGAPAADGSDTDAGAAYAFLGNLNASRSASTADIIVPGDANGDQMGRSVTCLSDADGDGESELVVAASHADSYAGNGGAVWVFDAPASGTLSTASAGGIIYCGTSGSVCGWSVADAGDTNGTGLSDLIVGGYAYGSSSSGGAFVFEDEVTGVKEAAANADAVLTGEASGDYAGWVVAGIGDVNDDGNDDVGVGAPYYGSGDAGRGYIVFGPLSTIGLGSADVIFDGEAGNDNAGYGLCRAGDVNGDGSDDALLGAIYAATNGVTYLNYGPLTAGTYPLGSADARFIGPAAYSEAGAACSGLGDVDDDGVDDFGLGAPPDDTALTNAGLFGVFSGSGI